MRFRNTESAFGLIAKLLHWLVAVLVFGLFGVGLYMVDLTYYDNYYQTAPFLHKSFGILLFILMVARVLWRWMNLKPAPLATHSSFEIKVAHVVHLGLYLLLLLTILSGYLISTADGRAIDFFGLFPIPSLTGNIDQLEDYAGSVHEILAWTIVVIVVLHVAGAVKHAVIDKDQTLRRML